MSFNSDCEQGCASKCLQCITMSKCITMPSMELFSFFFKLNKVDNLLTFGQLLERNQLEAPKCFYSVMKHVFSD